MLHSSTAPRTSRAQLQCEALEDRLALSWTSLPPAQVNIGLRTHIQFDDNNIAWGQATIQRREVDFYTFRAQTTGDYTISTWNPDDSLDTVLGVYSAATPTLGRRIASNDDVAEGSYWSQVTVSLTAGKRYFIGITNYVRSPNGWYYWRVDGPGTVDDGGGDEDNGGGGDNGGGDVNDWFAQNLADAGVAQAARNGFSDNSLGRADLLAIFQEVKQDNSVSNAELSSLRTIVSSAGVLSIPDYVRNLANKVVNNNAANAQYQGQVLGNLSAGVGGSHLQRLVNKWFLGLDRPAAQNESGSVNYAYQNAAGSLFVNGVSYQDVRQGAVGDCYMLAGLAEVALRNPQAIENMFIDNGDGTFTVRYFNEGVADYVTVDRALPTSNGRFIFANMGAQIGATTNELWVALAEKAYAQINESGWLRSHFGLPGNGMNSYQAIAGGWGGDALEQITGQNAVLWNNVTSANALINAWNNGALITLGSRGTSDTMMDGNGVVQRHAYAMIGYNASNGRFTFFNPWGVNNGSAPDLVHLTFAQVQQSFDSWDRVGAAQSGRDAALALVQGNQPQDEAALADQYFDRS